MTIHSTKTETQKPSEISFFNTILGFAKTEYEAGNYKNYNPCNVIGTEKKS